VYLNRSDSIHLELPLFIAFSRPPSTVKDEIIAIDPLRDGLGVLFVAGMDDHFGTFPGKGARDSRADIMRGSRYQRDFVFQ